MEIHYPKDKYLLVGKATKPHGLRGEVKVYCYSGQPENFLAYKELTLCDPKGNITGPIAVCSTRVQGKMAVVKLATVIDRSAAENIEGFLVLLLKEDLPEAKPGEYYWHHYQGKLLVDRDERIIGTVSSLFYGGAQDILVVDTGDGEVMVPVIDSFIIRETEDKIVVDLPPGLLEINADTLE